MTRSSDLDQKGLRTISREHRKPRGKMDVRHERDMDLFFDFGDGARVRLFRNRDPYDLATRLFEA